MKVIIDPYRGGNDTGTTINNQYEKNILLNLSKYMESVLKNQGINTELVRTSDISLMDEERNSIINEIKNNDDIIIQNRYSDDNEFDIIYPLRNSDKLPSLITRKLEENGITVNKYYQRRLPTNTTLDYYSLIRNTTPNETIIFEYNNLDNYQNTVNIIANAISEYIKKTNIYIVKKGDTLYQIANKFNTTIEKIKKANNLTTNSLSINQELIIPKNNSTDKTTNMNTYIVKKGDTLYSIAKNNNTSISEIKRINSLTSNTLNIGQTLTIPNNKLNEEESIKLYNVKKGDTLYSIAKNNNTSISEIKRINNLTSNTLSIGQNLKLPR